MAGLSASYINNTLAAEGITAATKQLILDFLNSAASAADIAGKEPREGPIFDDTEKGYGDQIRDYDIGIDVAKRIVSKRNALGGFTSLTQLAGISHFGADKFNDLLYSFSKRVAEISAIRFNYHNGSFTNDALNIRKNYSTAAPSPSWQKGISTTYATSPAAYSIKETQGNTLCIQASFSANGISAAFIRAIGGGRLGRVKERSISFNSAGQSGYETFELENVTFHAHGVDVFNISWRWQWRLKPTDTWKDLDRTRHRIFIILQAPTLPWVQSAGSTSLPWTDALEISCKWARGATDRDNAAALITTHYNGCGVVSYDTSVGATFYGSNTYNLSEMIERLNGGPGLGGLVNCTDSANTVSTLSNLVGCDLWQSRMESSFRLNKVISIGFSTWAVPFGWGFSYHEVAWKGACTASDSIFDGCLKVDGDPDPTTAPHTPLLPTNMLFGDCVTMNYRLRLCPPTSDGCARCEAQPSTRKRRPIV
jgi:hypothetical protein